MIFFDTTKRRIQRIENIWYLQRRFCRDFDTTKRRTEIPSISAVFINRENNPIFVFWFFELLLPAEPQAFPPFQLKVVYTQWLSTVTCKWYQTFEIIK